MIGALWFVLMAVDTTSECSEWNNAMRCDAMRCNGVGIKKSDVWGRGWGTGSKEGKRERGGEIGGRM